MKSIIFKLFIISVCVFGVLTPLISLPVSAEDVCNSSAPQAVLDANGCNGTKDALPDIIMNIVNVVIGIAGIIAVIYIIIGGYNYMTSTGDPGKVKKAKDTLMYAVIGLLVCILAAAIVNFVIRSATAQPTSNTPSSQQNTEPQKINTTPAPTNAAEE